MSKPFVHIVPAVIARVAIAAALTLALAGCSAIGLNRVTSGTAPYTDGSGVKTTVARTVAAYHAITASSGVTVIAHAGTAGVVSVTADDNLLGQIVTEVRDGTLYVGLQGGVRTANPLRVELANSDVDAVSAATGATVEADALKATSLSITASTGATIRAAGTAGSLRVTSGTGAAADLRDLVATQVMVDLTTGGSAHVRPTDSVTGTCTGGASLLVHGKPAHNDVSKDEGSTVKDGQ